MEATVVLVTRTGVPHRAVRRKRAETAAKGIVASTPPTSSFSDIPSVEGLRVCIVYDCLFPWTIGGAERWYRELAERFAEAGAQVTYLTIRQWKEEPHIRDVRVVAVAPRQNLYKSDGTRRFGPPIRFGVGVFGWLAYNRKEVDAVHIANFPYFSFLAAKLALLGTGTPIRVDWLEVWPKDFWRQYAGPLAGNVGYWVQEACIALSSHSFVFWEHTADRLRSRRLARRITVLPGLLPPAGDAQDASSPVRSTVAGPVPRVGHPFVLFAGRHIKDKGVRDLAPALAEARTEISDLQLVMVGEGPETSFVKDSLHQLGLTDSVIFPGKVDDDTLSILLEHAACLVVASIREGYGMMVVEASSKGTPSVVAGHPENAATGHIIESINGYVVEPTPKGLGRGIIRVIENGTPLRNTTKVWYDCRASSMTVTRSAEAVIALYAAEQKVDSRIGNLRKATGISVLLHWIAVRLRAIR